MSGSSRMPWAGATRRKWTSFGSTPSSTHLPEHRLCGADSPDLRGRLWCEGSITIGPSMLYNYLNPHLPILDIPQLFILGSGLREHRQLEKSPISRAPRAAFARLDIQVRAARGGGATFVTRAVEARRRGRQLLAVEGGEAPHHRPVARENKPREDDRGIRPAQAAPSTSTVFRWPRSGEFCRPSSLRTPEALLFTAASRTSGLRAEIRAARIPADRFWSWPGSPRSTRDRAFPLKEGTMWANAA